MPPGITTGASRRPQVAAQRRHRHADRGDDPLRPRPSGRQYPVVIKLWRTSWPQFVPFLDYDHEVRKVLYTTNIIESLNAWFGKPPADEGTSRPSKPR